MPGGRPSSDVVDRLDAMTPRWDDIVDRSRRARSVRDVHETEELAQHFADDLLIAVRGVGARRPSAGAKLVSGRKGAWS